MIVPNEGKLLWMSWALTGNGSDFENFVLELFKNDYTPDADSTLTDFTASTFTGYASKGLTRAGFSAPVIVDDQASATFTPTPTFTCTAGAGEFAYGWFMYGFTSQKVLLTQRFDTARNMSAGAKESIDPFTVLLDQIM